MQRSALGFLQTQGSIEVSDRARANAVALGVALCLDKDLVNLERVLVDHAVEAVITTLAKRAAGLFG